MSSLQKAQQHNKNSPKRKPISYLLDAGRPLASLRSLGLRAGILWLLATTPGVCREQVINDAQHDNVNIASPHGQTRCLGPKHLGLSLWPEASDRVSHRLEALLDLSGPAERITTEVRWQARLLKGVTALRVRSTARFVRVIFGKVLLF